MKTKVLAVAVMVTVSIGTVMALYLMQIGPFTTDENASQVEAEKIVPPVYLDLSPIVVSIIKNSRLITNVELELTFQLREESLRQVFKKQMRSIENGFIQTLSTQLPKMIRTHKDAVDMDLLKTHLIHRAQRLFPDGEIVDIFIQSVRYQ